MQAKGYKTCMTLWVPPLRFNVQGTRSGRKKIISMVLFFLFFITAATEDPLQLVDQKHLILSSVQFHRRGHFAEVAPKQC